MPTRMQSVSINADCRYTLTTQGRWSSHKSDAGLDEKSMDSQLICEACLGRAELVCTVSAESRY